MVLNGTSPPVVLTTPGLRMDVADVKSERASNLTDSHWDANVGLGDDNLPEVPPDGMHK